MSFRLRRVRARSLARHREMSPEERRHSVEAASRRILERNWVPTPGFTMPNRKKYPWQWLWDSCFHAIAWSRLGDPRGVKELESVLSLQLPSGFVPHMGYWAKPAASLALWHVLGRSDITQPPMYGHTLRLLAERGFAVAHLQDAATAGLNYLLEHRRDPGSGLIRVVHPWAAMTVRAGMDCRRHRSRSAAGTPRSESWFDRFASGMARRGRIRVSMSAHRGSAL